VSEYKTPTGWFRATPQLLLPFDSSSGAPENHQHTFWVALWQIQHRLFANSIWQGDCLGDIESSCVWIWDTARLLMAIQHLLLAYAQIAGALESPGHISSWLSLHNCQSHSAINTVDTIIEFLCQNTRHGLTYSWQSCNLCRNIIVGRKHLRSESQSVGDWDMARVFMVKLHLLLLGMSWPMIDVQAQLRSASQSRMMFLDFYEVKFGKLRLIMNVSFQVRHASTATLSLQSACSPLHSALFISVCFILIMFSSALNQWTLCSQIVISQDTAHLGAGGSSRSPSANISIYAWSVYEGHH